MKVTDAKKVLSAPGCCAVLAAGQNTAADAIQEQRHRALDKVGRMGQDLNTAPKPLSNKIDVDPTKNADGPSHIPSRAARKLAEKGERLSKKDRHAEAIEAFEQAIAADPAYFEAENELALEYESAGDLDRPIAQLRHLSTAVPDYVVGLTNLATLLCNTRQYREAEEVARRAVRLHPYSFKANLVLGTALVGQGSYSLEARRDLEYAALKHPAAKQMLSRWPSQ